MEGGQPKSEWSTKHTSLATQKANSVAQPDGTISQGTPSQTSSSETPTKKTMTGSRLAMTAGAWPLFAQTPGTRYNGAATSCRNPSVHTRRASGVNGPYPAEVHSDFNTNYCLPPYLCHPPTINAAAKTARQAATNGCVCACCGTPPRHTVSDLHGAVTSLLL